MHTLGFTQLSRPKNEKRRMNSFCYLLENMHWPVINLAAFLIRPIWMTFSCQMIHQHSNSALVANWLCSLAVMASLMKDLQLFRWAAASHGLGCLPFHGQNGFRLKISVANVRKRSKAQSDTLNRVNPLSIPLVIRLAGSERRRTRPNLISFLIKIFNQICCWN